MCGVSAILGIYLVTPKVQLYNTVMRKIFLILFLSIIFFQPAWAAQNYRVDKVLDGNTLLLSNGEKVRMIGVEVSTPEGLVFLRQLIEGRGIKLEFDQQKKDDEGQLLAYVLMIETLVNATVIHAGYGIPKSMPPNTRNDVIFSFLYQDAKQNKRGLWKTVNSSQRSKTP